MNKRDDFTQVSTFQGLSHQGPHSNRSTQIVRCDQVTNMPPFWLKKQYLGYMRADQLIVILISNYSRGRSQENTSDLQWKTKSTLL